MLSPLSVLFYLISPAESLKISPEVPTDLSISLCSHSSRPRTHGHMQFFPAPVAFCGSLRSSKHRRHQLHDERQSTFLSSAVHLSWRNVASHVKCRVQFKGYQGEYRFWPDFGAYEECQSSMSRHLYNLPESPWQGDHLPVELNDTNPECPLTALPATYGDFVSCSLMENAWYVLEWQSAIRYETFWNASYGTYWANHSTTFVFHPSDRLSLNGTEADWLKRLLTIETRAAGCEKASVLILLDPHWIPISSVSVVYRIRHAHQKVFSQLLISQSIDRWLQLDFGLNPLVGHHEVCVQLSSSAVPSLRQKTCRTIIDHRDCPFVSSSPPSLASSVVVVLLALLLTF